MQDDKKGKELTKDKNYIDIIHMNWNFIEKEIKDIFSGLQNK